MIIFLLKGLLRDRQRSIFPVSVVIIGVTLTVVFSCWLGGILVDMLDFNANFSTGHLKIITKAYNENKNQRPLDLALVGVDELIENLHENLPGVNWVKRINFGGLIDVPDENGETKSQGPAIGMAVDLFSEQSMEMNRLNIEKSLVRGYIPEKPGEILISEEFAGKLDVNPGDAVTLLSSTMYGSMAFQNFIIKGTVLFGIRLMDKGAIIIDISDAQNALNMEDAAGELLGYFDNKIYDDRRAAEIAGQFNARYSGSDDEFAPLMLRLKEQNDLGNYMNYMEYMTAIVSGVFLLVMSIVLWNVGLIGGLRRYGEYGLRLAIGEYKNHVYKMMIYESVLVGIFGSVIGSGIGLGISYYLQVNGLDVSRWLENATVLFPNVYRAYITPEAYYIGFFPGLFSVVLGTALSGIGIYKRQTARLFKELEV